MSIIRRDTNLRGKFSLFIDDLSRVPATNTLRQLQRMKDCDSATIDPHKWAISHILRRQSYRNGQLKISQLLLVHWRYPVNPSQEPSVAIYGLEGSKPGARAAAVFLSHRSNSTAERLWQDRQPIPLQYQTVLSAPTVDGGRTG